MGFLYAWCEHHFVSELNQKITRQIFSNSFWVAKSYVVVFFSYFLGIAIFDTVYVHCSPDGRRVKTKAQLARILGNKFDLAGFDFGTGWMLSAGVHRCEFERYSQLQVGPICPTLEAGTATCISNFVSRSTSSEWRNYEISEIINYYELLITAVSTLCELWKLTETRRYICVLSDSHSAIQLLLLYANDTDL